MAKGLLKEILNGGWAAKCAQIDALQEQIDNAAPPEKVTGTRGEILALRNAGSLVAGAEYCVTDFSRSCLSSPEILLHAIDANTLSHDADIVTNFDNTAWEGSYDIDTHRITRLYDNLGNRVEGRYGNEVDRFPWGNTRWTENVVDNADVFVECDTELTATNNRFTNDASVTLTGAAGTIRNSTFADDAIIQLTDATGVLVQASNFDSRARLYANGVDGITLYYHDQSSEAFWQVADQANVRSYYSTFDSASRVYYTGGTEQWFYYTDLSSYAHVRQFAGALRLYYSSMDSYSELRNEAGAGTFYGYGINYSARGYVRNFNTNFVHAYYDAVESRGEVNYRDAADVRTYYNQIAGYGRLLMSGTATVAYASEISSQATLTLTGGNHYRDTLFSLARITTATNTRSVYGFGSWAQTLTAANSNRGRDYFNNSLI